MANKAGKKIIDALSELLEGFGELRESVNSGFKPSEEETEDSGDEEKQAEADAALVTEMRNSLEAVIDADDLSAQDVAACISFLTEALEEIDPDVFSGDTDDESAEEEAIYGESTAEDDLDDIDDDDDDYYGDEDDEDDDDDESPDEDDDEEEEDY